MENIAPYLGSLIPCEVCLKEQASEFQGGVINNMRQLWFCCKKCKQKILDERKNK
jgi:hypothetical protein